jgi:hypothetical protein
MADVLVLDTVATHNFSENIHTNNGSLCDYVTQLKQELHELWIEIKSLNKIQNYDQNNVVLREGNQRDCAVIYCVGIVISFFYKQGVEFYLHLHQCACLYGYFVHHFMMSWIFTRSFMTWILVILCIALGWGEFLPEVLREEFWKIFLTHFM